jgi:hypothetical protein
MASNVESTTATTTDTATPAIASTSESSPAITEETETEVYSPQRSYLEVQEEGILRDVLLELDRERSKRAELEAQVRMLEEEVHHHRKKSCQATTSSSMNLHTKQDYLSLQTEKIGYLELLDALTKDRPAFSANHQSLPLHVIRMLEIIPWDPRAKPHLFGQERVYEWQMWNAQKNWQKELRYFPTFFKTLPIVIPRSGHFINDAPSSSSPPKQCVLTNLQVTTIYNIDKGYPLPEDGGNWQWVGGWRIEKSMDTDDQGWSYSNDPQLASSTSYYSQHTAPQRGETNIVKRRRKWTRSRVLVDYPYASAMTREYLKLVASKAELQVTVEKLSEQLVETKMSLTSLEAEQHDFQEQTRRKIQKLKAELEEKTAIIAAFEENPPPTTKTKEPVKEVKSLVTSWIGGSSNVVIPKKSNDSMHNGSTIYPEEDEEESATAGGTLSNKQQLFEWTKGRDFLEKVKKTSGQGIEKIKQTGGQGMIEKFKEKSSGLAWQRTVEASASKPDATEKTASKSGP